MVVDGEHTRVDEVLDLYGSSEQMGFERGRILRVGRLHKVTCAWRWGRFSSVGSRQTGMRGQIRSDIGGGCALI